MISMSEVIVPLLELARGAFCSSEIGILNVAVVVSVKVLTVDSFFTDAFGGSILRIG